MPMRNQFLRFHTESDPFPFTLSSLSPNCSTTKSIWHSTSVEKRILPRATCRIMLLCRMSPYRRATSVFQASSSWCSSTSPDHSPTTRVEPVQAISVYLWMKRCQSWLRRRGSGCCHLLRGLSTRTELEASSQLFTASSSNLAPPELTTISTAQNTLLGKCRQLSLRASLHSPKVKSLRAQQRSLPLSDPTARKSNPPRFMRLMKCRGPGQNWELAFSQSAEARANSPFSLTCQILSFSSWPTVKRVREAGSRQAPVTGFWCALGMSSAGVPRALRLSIRRSQFLVRDPLVQVLGAVDEQLAEDPELGDVLLDRVLDHGLVEAAALGVEAADAQLALLPAHVEHRVHAVPLLHQPDLVPQCRRKRLYLAQQKQVVLRAVRVLLAGSGGTCRLSPGCSCSAASACTAPPSSRACSIVDAVDAGEVLPRPCPPGSLLARPRRSPFSRLRTQGPALRPCCRSGAWSLLPCLRPCRRPCRRPLPFCPRGQGACACSPRKCSLRRTCTRSLESWEFFQSRLRTYQIREGLVQNCCAASGRMPSIFLTNRLGRRLPIKTTFTLLSTKSSSMQPYTCSPSSTTIHGTSPRLFSCSTPQSSSTHSGHSSPSPNSSSSSRRTFRRQRKRRPGKDSQASSGVRPGRWQNMRCSWSAKNDVQGVDSPRGCVRKGLSEVPSFCYSYSAEGRSLLRRTQQVQSRRFASRRTASRANSTEGLRSGETCLAAKTTAARARTRGASTITIMIHSADSEDADAVGGRPEQLLELHELDGDVVQLHPGRALQVSEVLEDHLDDAVQLIPGVLVLAVLGGEVQAVVGVVHREKLVGAGDGLVDVEPHRHARLVGPAAGHVGDGVASASEEHGGDVELEEVVEAGAVAPESEVELAQGVVGQGVCAQLQDDGVGVEEVHDSVHHLLEQLEVGLVRNALLQGHVHRVELARALPGRVQRARPWEKVLLVLVEADRHHSVREKERLLHSVPVVHVDVHVEHSRELLQQLENAEHDVVNVAEARGLALFGVVEPAAPVDGDVGHVGDEGVGAVDGCPGGELAEVVEPVEGGTVVLLLDVEPELGAGVGDAASPLLGGQVADPVAPELHLLDDVVVDEVLEVVGVLGTVELHDLGVLGLAREVGVQLAVEPQRVDQRVRHRDALGLHRVLLVVAVLPDLLVVEVAHARPRVHARQHPGYQLQSLSDLVIIMSLPSRREGGLYSHRASFQPPPRSPLDLSLLERSKAPRYKKRFELNYELLLANSCKGAGKASCSNRRHLPTFDGLPQSKGNDYVPFLRNKAKKKYKCESANSEVERSRFAVLFQLESISIGKPLHLVDRKAPILLPRLCKVRQQGRVRTQAQEGFCISPWQTESDNF